MKVLWVLQTLSWEKTINHRYKPRLPTRRWYQNTKMPTTFEFWDLLGSAPPALNDLRFNAKNSFLPISFDCTGRIFEKLWLLEQFLWLKMFFFLGGGWLVFWGFFLGWGPHKMETNKYRIQRRMFRNQCGRGIYPYVWYAMSPTFVVDWYSDWMSFFSAQGVLSNIDTLH